LLSYSLAGTSCPNSVRGWAPVSADSKMESKGSQTISMVWANQRTPSSLSQTNHCSDPIVIGPRRLLYAGQSVLNFAKMVTWPQGRRCRHFDMDVRVDTRRSASEAYRLPYNLFKFMKVNIPRGAAATAHELLQSGRGSTAEKLRMSPEGTADFSPGRQSWRNMSDLNSPARDGWRFRLSLRYLRGVFSQPVYFCCKRKAHERDKWSI
jgi:hypothetical protein